LGTGKYKIKGILLLLSFQDGVFGESHRRGLEKIVNLFPLDNFWDYITIVFTKTHCGEDDDIEELKEQTLKDYKEIFDVLISAFNKTKNIKKVEFSSIKTVFINSRIKKMKIENQDELISILKQNSELDPFFHEIKVEEKSEQLMVLNKDNENLGDLFDVKFKVYNYYNEKGKIVKSISKPVSKKYIRQIEKKECDGKFQKYCAATLVISCISCFVTLGLASICPPVTFGAAFFGFTSLGISAGSALALGIKDATEYLSNKEFNEQTVINEILIEEEENL
jgi:hypothetical protein